MMFERIVEGMIKEAIDRGEFEGLPGRGQRIDLSAYFETPEGLRLSYSLVKNAGVLPRELELAREAAELEDTFAMMTPGAERRALARKIQDLRLRQSLLAELRQPHRWTQSHRCSRPELPLSLTGF